MPTSFVRQLILSVALSVITFSAVADERSNPFIAPPSNAEEQARQDQRMRNIVWELHPEMKSMIMQDVMASVASLEIKMRRQIDSSISAASEEMAAKFVAAPFGSEASSPDAIAESGTSQHNLTEMLAESKFIACVNGKALYRDQNNTIFQVAENSESGVNRCSD